VCIGAAHALAKRAHNFVDASDDLLAKRAQEQVSCYGPRRELSCQEWCWSVLATMANWGRASARLREARWTDKTNGTRTGLG